MVVHLCCGVDAGYFLKRLQEEFPEERLIGYFYDPNIHPYREFQVRSAETQRICKKLGVEFIEGEYDLEEWFAVIAGMEKEPEKGKRCARCFDYSLEKTARFAKKIGENRITTSLLMSPMKSHSQIKNTADQIWKRFGIKFLVPDYRKKGGTQRQQAFAKETQLYRQNYCGCLYGVYNQKNRKGEPVVEFLSPLNRSILPGSPEERLELLLRRQKLEKSGKSPFLLSTPFLNYRLLRGGIKREGKSIPAHILFYSHLSGGVGKRGVRGYLEKQIDGIFYLNRGGVILVPLNRFNRELESIGIQKVASIQKLQFEPFSVEIEIEIRNRLTGTPYSLAPILVVEEISDGPPEGELITGFQPGIVRYEIFIQSVIFPDTRLQLVEGNNY